MSNGSNSGKDRIEVELSPREARRILMALTVRRHSLSEDGYNEDAWDYKELAQRIARLVQAGGDE